MTDRKSAGERRKLDDLNSLTADSVRDITNDNERVRAALISKNGLTHIEGGSHRELDATIGLGVTDRRIVFVTPPGGGHEAASIPYHDLAGVEYHIDTRVIEFIDCDGERWRYKLPASHIDVVQATVRHLQWIGEVRSRIVACGTDVDLAAERIRDLVDEMKWEEATAAYEEIRERLDQLIVAVQVTEPIADDILAPELTAMERTLEEAHVRLYIERANSDLELATYLVENEEFERANTVLGRAAEYQTFASGQRAAVERSDAFEFGRQRDLKESIQELEWELDTVAAEPIRQAHEAKILADMAGSDAEEIEHLEDAHRRYTTLDELGWDVGHVSGEIDNARDSVGQRLLDAYIGHARSRWNRGADHQDAGEITAALEACLDAREYLDRAMDLAATRESDRLVTFEQQLERMDEMIASLRRDRDAADDATTTADESRVAEPEPSPSPDDTESAKVPSIDDIETIDTHHDITLDLPDPQESTASESAESTTESDAGSAATDDLIADAVDGVVEQVPEADQDSS